MSSNASAHNFLFVQTSTPLNHIITHVFFPPQLPSISDCTLENDLSLVRAVRAAARAYNLRCGLYGTSESRWDRILQMLRSLQAFVQSECLEKDDVVLQLRSMQTGDILPFFIRPQNAALILTKQENHVLFESFEVSPRSDAVETAGGALICTYPGSAVETPNEVFDDEHFQSELADFLSLPDNVDSDLYCPPRASPQYVTALLPGILRVLGRIADVPRITKRIRDNVGQWPLPSGENESKGNWRRSPIWVLIRVAIQTSVERSPLGWVSYKNFMLFFVCRLARKTEKENVSSDLLHLMSSKIFRRLTKLGNSTPNWLSEMALKTCSHLQEILDDRLKPLSTRMSSFRNPSQDELRRDMKPTLLDSREYIHDALTHRDHKPLSTPFHPSHHCRGTIDDFLSSNGSFFDEAYDADPDVTLYDVERLVEQGIDDWCACVTNVHEACSRLEILMDKYMMMAFANDRFVGNIEHQSIVFLTAIELFVALDKLVVEEIPMLADYSPELPIASLQKLLLRKKTNLHRLSRAYQYLSERHSRSRPQLSVLSNEFTEDSFPVRYYDQSPHLQRLKVLIEHDMIGNVVGCDGLEGEVDNLADNYRRYQENQLLEGAEIPGPSPFPPSLPHVKAIIFELQCPPCLQIWRSGAFRLLRYFYLPLYDFDSFFDKEEYTPLLAHVPVFQPYVVHREGPPVRVQVHPTYVYSGTQPLKNTLHYAIRHFTQRSTGNGTVRVDHLSVWGAKLKAYLDNKQQHQPLSFKYNILSHMDSQNLVEYMESTHTSNGVLAAQVECPAHFSLDEYTTFGHLRSGGLLQWLNILRGLRSRTLNFRRPEVHYLLSQTISQVGPLDLNTAEWHWHQELQDAAFCHGLLDELHTLFIEVGATSIDRVVMSAISLTLSRVLASSPSEDVSARTITLLRSVRRKTFSWVHELAYNLTMAPTNEERSHLLQDMAAICRSTFDVDPATLCKVFDSTLDVGALLSCAFLLPTFHSQRGSIELQKYTSLLLQRDSFLPFSLEQILRNVIRTDASDHAVDLAVSMVFACHKPSARRWEQLQSPNARWLTCKTGTTGGQSSHVVHLNLLDGVLRLDGQPLGGLPRAIQDSPEFQEIFQDQGFFLIPSSLPGMDFTTLGTMSEQKVHFSLRGDDLAVRVQCNQSNEILELIPSSKLKKDLPPGLISAHVHWLNLSTKIIEIRPLKRLWEQSSEHWRIDCASGQYHIYKGRETLVDIRSPTWKMISECFGCLDILAGQIFQRAQPNAHEDSKQPLDALITTSPGVLCSVPALQLSVALPRYGLSFFVNEQGELESRDFKNMVYDEDQYVPALFGLESLVLRQKHRFPKELIPRCTLVPSGSLEKHDDHRVQVRLASTDLAYIIPNSPLRYHTYVVDTELGCLRGDEGLLGLQYLARLHATTSYHRPDPLTCKTGVHSAFCLLQSAGCRSIMELKAPKNPEECASAQYPQVNVACLEIQRKYYWARESHKFNRLRYTREKRAAQRAGHLCPLSIIGVASEELQYHGDVEYCATPEWHSELESVAFTAASAVHSWLTSMPTMNTISNWIQLLIHNLPIDAIEATLHGSTETISDVDLLQTLPDTVHNILQIREKNCQRFQLLFLLPTIAYRSSNYQAAFFSMLIEFAKRLQPRSVDSLFHVGYKISDGYRPTEEVLRHHICEARLAPRDFDQDLEDAALKDMLRDWPCTTPTVVSLQDVLHRYWDVTKLTASLQSLFSSCYHNFNLKEQLMRVLTEPGLLIPPRTILSPRHTPSKPLQVTLDQLLLNRIAPELPHRITLFKLHGNYTNVNKAVSKSLTTLDRLFSSLRTDHLIQREYMTHLEASARHICCEPPITRGLVVEPALIGALEEHYAQCRANYLDSLATVKQSLGPTANLHDQTFTQFGQWPPITADVLLRYLASTSPFNLSVRWRGCLISLALLLLDVQRARRLLRFALDGQEEELSRELENEGCDGWDPEKYPDWLLIQVQGNFLIRRDQAETAMEVISPGSGENTLMQVNMGKGKSSVVVPITAAALADGKQLVRVIVPKSLTTQMFELLVARLGGLANRPIYHLPFSRAPKCHSGRVISLQIDDLHKLTSECMVKHGILLIQPEHVVSLKLMSVEEQIREGKLTVSSFPRLHGIKHILSLKLFQEDSFVGMVLRRLTHKLSSHPNEKDVIHVDSLDKQNGSAVSALDNASKWLSFSKWIYSHTRDILDESDETLHARFQLVYTIGLEQYIDGYPDRWTVTQQVLHLVKVHATALARYDHDSLEYIRGPPGSFPRVRIAPGSDIGTDLISLIVKDIMNGQLPNFNFRHFPAELHRAIRSFISDKHLHQDTVKRVEEFAERSRRSYLWNGLLLLRGLLASDVLLFAFTEWRWRVNFGLTWHPARQGRTLAVPYRAKGIPAPNTQFGHPDITIILTCLAYYYAGLNEEELRISFEILLDEDDPSREYALWIKEYDPSTSVPDSLRVLSEVNLRTSEQWDKDIFPLFTRNQATVDFYLSRVVFPREAKEYPWKITGSSWDLAEKREKLITGFSGTSDGRWLLPTSIAQRDLDYEQGTDARVLAYILQPENDFYMVTSERGERWTTHRLLEMITTQQPQIRVLLDVGAQILDLSNEEVARTWLDIANDVSGAIYFNKNDELMVLTPGGVIGLVLSSPLSQQLDHYVVYLDHAHTRGTDLKFPIGSRAAVTLGPKVTKDQLVQGCMRMRGLGRGHSVMFFAPLEVDRSIRAITAKHDSTAKVNTIDILRWVIHETWVEIHQRAPRWVKQGMNHKSRCAAWNRFCDNELTLDQLSDAWLEPEVKSLVDLYAPCETKKASAALLELDPDIRQCCKDLGILSLPDSQLEEEQEREVNREQEREREVEVPPRANPAKHFLHQDVVIFVKTGILPRPHSDGAFHPVFTTLKKSTAVTLDSDVWSPFILATADFCRTIDPESTQGTIDQYLRSVQWILTRKDSKDNNQVLVLLSPFEVDLLMPDIRASKHVHLHLYAPRTSQRMKPSDDLKLYVIPPLSHDWTPPWDLIDQLNVFAGQLYFGDHQSYLRLCRFLSVPTEESPDDAAVRWNLFNIPGSFEGDEIRFSSSPLPFVWALLAIRNRMRPFTETHMGKILQGQTLTKRNFEHSASLMSGASSTASNSKQVPHCISRETRAGTPLLSDVDYDAQQNPPSLPRPSKRGSEMARIPDTDSEPPQKRPRIG